MSDDAARTEGRPALRVGVVGIGQRAYIAHHVAASGEAA